MDASLSHKHTHILWTVSVHCCQSLFVLSEVRHTLTHTYTHTYDPLMNRNWVCGELEKVDLLFDLYDLFKLFNRKIRMNCNLVIENTRWENLFAFLKLFICFICSKKTSCSKQNNVYCKYTPILSFNLFITHLCLRVINCRHRTIGINDCTRATKARHDHYFTICGEP